MEAPILLLYPEIVSQIAYYLDYTSVKRLETSGNARLANLLRLGVRNISAPKYVRFLDLQSLFDLAGGYKCIDTFILRPLLTNTPAKLPTEVLNLPNSITNLRIRFPGAVSLFLDNILISQLPNLRKLQLVADESPRLITLSGIKFPAQLESLELFPRCQELTIETGDIDGLPKGLSMLGLSISSAGLPNFEKYEWPLSLTHFELEVVYNTHVLLEHLPRTVQKLICWNVPRWKTTYGSQDESTHISFPWRVFFPRLAHLQLESFDESFNSDLLKTLLLSDILAPPLVDAFLRSSFWNLPTFHDHQPTFSRFTSLWIPSPYVGLSLDDVESEIRLLAPLLTDTNLWLYPELPLELSKYLPSVKAVLLDSSTTETTQLHRSLSELSCPNGEAHLSVLPNTLESLSAKGIGELNADGTVIEGVEDRIRFPSTLNTFMCTLSRVPDVLICALPPSLTKLHILIGEPDQWDLVATRLSGLVSLVAHFHTSWKCPSTRTLAPLTSKSIVAVSLHLTSNRDQSTVPCSEFISDSSTGASVLPQSLKKLSLVSTVDVIPIGVIVALSSYRLSALLLEGIDWFPSPETNAHYNTTGLSHEQILQQLPPNLRKLGLTCSAKVPKKADFSVLKALPPLLVYFSTSHAFDNEPIGTYESKEDYNQRRIGYLPLHMNYVFFGIGHIDLRDAYRGKQTLEFPCKP